MRNLVLAFAALLLVACVQSPPEHFSISDDFSEGEASTIRAAVSAWCDAAGWCPTEALWTDSGRFELVDHIETMDCPEGYTECTVAGRNDGDVIRIARDRAAPENMAILFIVAAHETGHFCAEHTARGLMSAFHGSEEASLEVDAEAVRAWRAGCP